MDCISALARIMVNRMNDLGWLVPGGDCHQGDSSSSLNSLIHLDQPQCISKTCHATFNFETKTLEATIDDGEIGTTYTLTLVDEDGKLKEDSQIALYLAPNQRYKFNYKMGMLEILYVNLTANKKGFQPSLTTKNRVYGTIAF